jgi:exosortase A
MKDFAPLRPAALGLLLGLAMWSVLFTPEMLAAVHVWSTSTAYNHCFLVAPIALWLIWERRAGLAGLTPRANIVALCLAAGFALVWLLAERLGLMEGRQLAAMGLLQSLLLGVLGWRVYRVLMAGLLYLIFLVPFGGFLVPALQSFTAQFTAHGLDILGIPNYVTGETIQITAGTFYIAQACAGLRFLIAAIAFSVLYALVIFRSPYRRVMFVLLSLVVPVIANGFRALGIVWLGSALGSAKAAATDHVLYGYIFFSIVLGLLILLGLPFRQDHITANAAAIANPVPAKPISKSLSLYALAFIFIAALGPLYVARVNRAIAATPVTITPSLAGCTALPDQPAPGVAQAGGVVRLYQCADAHVQVEFALFPPATDPGIIFDTRRHLSGEDIDEAMISGLTLKNGELETWQFVQATKPQTTTLSALFIDGAPSAGTLKTRAREAWHDLFGGTHLQLVVVVASNAPGSAGATAIEDYIASGALSPEYLRHITSADQP